MRWLATFAAIVAAVLLTAGAGCSSSQPGEQPCQTDLDCVGRVGPLASCEGATCLVELGECRAQAFEDGVACEDGDPCTAPDACLAGDCQAGDPVDTESCQACVGVDCLACSEGLACADSPPHLDGTCCKEGDNLLYIGSGRGAEVVDIETDGLVAVACGGFGADFSLIDEMDGLSYLGGAATRCQRIAFGPDLPPGGQIVYLAHHGDSWVDSPFLAAIRVSPLGGVNEVGTLREAGVLYEGMVYHGGHLYVAAHQGGLRVYDVDELGMPSHRATLDEFENAWKVAADGDYVYVADFSGGLKVVSIEDPGRPTLVRAVETSGPARDVEIHQGRIYVALGADGLDVFDGSRPDQPVLYDHVETEGSIQAVSVDGDLVGLAAWSHLALLDRESLRLIASEELTRFPTVDQVLGVAVSGDRVLAGEWSSLHLLRYREGYVAADLFIEDELFSFDASEQSARALVIRNRGALDLVVEDVTLEHPGQFALDKTSLTIPPGQGGVVEVVYTPPQSGANGSSKLTILSNDPDLNQNPLDFHLIVDDQGGDKLNVGDRLTADFGFLDYSGVGDVEALEGKVLVLAYFALF